MKKHTLKKIIWWIFSILFVLFLTIYGQFIWYCERHGNFDLMVGCVSANDPVSSLICMQMIKHKYLRQAEIDALNQDAGAARVIFMDDREKSEELLKFMISRGLDVNSASTKSKSNLTALHIAAADGDVVAVKLLLQYGARKNVKDVLGRTPADLAGMEIEKHPENKNYQIIENILAEKT